MSYPYQQYQPAGPAAGPPYQPAAYGGYAEPAYNPAPYNPGPAAYGPPGGYGGGDEIRTIFVTGFPEDTHERELINMCRFLPDYEVRSVPAVLLLLPDECARHIPVPASIGYTAQSEGACAYEELPE